MQYAVTARKTRNPITIQHYEDYLGKISDLGEVGNLNYEYEKGLHIHFLVRSNERVNYKDFRPTKRGWNVKVVPVYNEHGWIRYVNKHASDPSVWRPTQRIFKKSLFKNHVQLNAKCNNNKCNIT